MRMENRSILIFVKAPVAGFAKTRLASVLTPVQAAQLYQAMAEDTYKVACQVPGSRVYVAYHPHPQSAEPRWLLDTSQGGWFNQEGEELGERLQRATARVFAASPHPLVVIGSDLPGLTPTLLEKAFGLLRAAPVVLGPSADGGYYLIGLRQPQEALFQEIRWSEPTVLDQTLDRVRALHLDYKLLPRRADLDTSEDFQRLRNDPALLALEFRRTSALLRKL